MNALKIIKQDEGLKNGTTVLYAVIMKDISQEMAFEQKRNKVNTNQAWWFTPVILALHRLRQEDSANLRLA